MAIRAIFTDAKQCSDTVLKRLKDYIGLTGVIPDDGQVHHCGFHFPPSLTMEGPIGKWAEREKEVELHRRIILNSGNGMPVLPGIASAYDDASFLNLIDRAERIGLEVWGHLGLWGYGGDIFPEYSFKDIDGKSLSEKYYFWGVPFCPNNETILNWTRDCIIYAIKHYNIKAFDFDHGHFPPPWSIDSLFGCACSHCKAKAVEWGYDFESLAGSMKNLKKRLFCLEKSEFERISEISGDFIEFLYQITKDDNVKLWFEFRQHSTTNHMRYLTEAAREASKGKCPVDSHMMPPSFAHIAGQDVFQWSNSTDRLSAGWGGVVGWEHSVTRGIAELAEFFMKNIEGLDEEKTVCISRQLLGCSAVDLPNDIEKLKGHIIPSNGELYHFQTKYAHDKISDSKIFLAPLRIFSYEDKELEFYKDIFKISSGNFVFSSGMEESELISVARLLKDY